MSADLPAITAAAIAVHKRRCNCAIPHREGWPGYSRLEYEYAEHALTAALPALTAAVAARAAAAERAKADGAYRERDQLVAALSKLFPAHLVRHEGADWEDDWRNIVCIHLPAGQVTWHIHESELPLVWHLERGEAHWDGHSTDEKYRRLNLLAGTADGAVTDGGTT